MPRRIDAEVAVQVTGADKVDKLEKQLDDLSGGKTEVPVEVDTGTAARDITDLLAKVDKLAADPAQLLLASNAVQIANDIAGLLVDIDKLDSSDPTIDAKITNVNQLTGDLDQIQAKVKEIDDTKVTVDTTPTVGGINRVSDSARGANNALANMVGNATQDLGALGGVAGSSGVAIGQMGEYMADAAGSGEKLTSVLGNFSKVGVPILAVSVATNAIAGHFEGIRKDAAANAEQARGFADALQDGATAAEAVETSLAKVGKIQFTIDGKVFDVTDRLAKLGLAVDQFSTLVAGGVPAINEWGDTMIAAGANVNDVKDVVLAASIQAENLADAQRLSAINAKVFGQENKKAAVSTEDATQASKLYAAQLGLAASRIISFAAVQKQNAEDMQGWVDEIHLAADGAVAYSDALKGIDYKTASIDGAVTAMSKFNKKAFDLANIAQGVHESFAALGETLHKTTEDGQKRIALTGDVATEAGRAQQDAIEGVAQALELEFAAAYDKAGGSLEKFRDSAKQIGDATLGQLQDELGLTDDEVALLRDQLNLTAKDYTARFELSGAEEAQLKLDLLSTSIDDLPKDVKTTVTQEIIKGDYKGALKDIQDFYDDNPATVVVVPTVSRGPTSNPIFGGPTTTGLAATATTTATTTSATTTATAPVRAPAAGRTQIVNQYMTFNAGVIGGGYDVMTTVDAAMRKAARLLPKAM